jgi:hypothetical protein
MTGTSVAMNGLLPQISASDGFLAPVISSACRAGLCRQDCIQSFKKPEQIAQTLERDASSEFTEPYKSNKRNAQLMNVPESQAACVEAFKMNTNWIKKNGFYFLFSNFLLPSSTPYLAFAQ